MDRTTRTILLRYCGAVGFTAPAVLLRWLLDPWMGDFLPFPTLYGAVAVATGVGSGVPVERRTAHECTFSDGQLVRFKVYSDREQALAGGPPE